MTMGDGLHACLVKCSQMCASCNGVVLVLLLMGDENRQRCDGEPSIFTFPLPMIAKGHSFYEIELVFA